MTTQLTVLKLRYIGPAVPGERLRLRQLIKAAKNCYGFQVVSCVRLAKGRS